MLNISFLKSRPVRFPFKMLQSSFYCRVTKDGNTQVLWSTSVWYLSTASSVSWQTWALGPVSFMHSTLCPPFRLRLRGLGPGCAPGPRGAAGPGTLGNLGLGPPQPASDVVSSHRGRADRRADAGAPWRGEAAAAPAVIEERPRLCVWEGADRSWTTRTNTKRWFIL